MKINWRKLTCALICLMALMLCHAALAEDGWEYFVAEDGYARITAYTGGGTAVTVPDKLDGNWVVGIGEAAFEAAEGMRSVTIPGTVTDIHEAAFSGRTDFRIRARNGSAAMKFAAAGIPCENLSTLYFTEGVVDMTGLRSPEYSYITNGVRLLNVHARRLEVGSLFFLPPDERSKLGEAYEVRAMEPDGKFVKIKMSKALPELVLTKVKFTLTDLKPDCSNIEILSDCITGLEINKQSRFSD